jgi:hypothetical protein
MRQKWHPIFSDILACFPRATYPDFRNLPMIDQEIVARTDELTETVQVVTESFPNLRADHRPNDADWYRWLIYDDLTSKVIGIVALGEPSEKSLSLPDTKVLLRKRTLSLALQAA